MTQSTHQARNSESGFTLVELAIVMIIIGLLIGGILKGQELINNARVSSSVTQLKGFEGAINTFNDKFSARPGDMATAQVTARIPNCAAAPCNFAAANGNGQIAGDSANPGAAQAALSESTAANVQLTQASMFSGNVNTTAAFGPDLFADFNLGGKMRIAYLTGAVFTGSLAAAPEGHYIVAGTSETATAAAGSIAVSAAAAIDRKVDDGLPNTGSVRGGSAAAGATSCVEAGGNYNEAANVSNCTVLYKALQ